MILVADNLTITDRHVEIALAKMEPEFIRELVKKCEDTGADAIDVNVGPLGRHCDKVMDFVVRAVQGTTDLPILLDTANPDAMEVGLTMALLNIFHEKSVKIARACSALADDRIFSWNSFSC